MAEARPQGLASPPTFLLHDADLHERMASEEENDFDRASFWEDAALMRKYAIELFVEGVSPAEIEWKEDFAHWNARSAGGSAIER